MSTEWKELKTLEEVVAAQAANMEIEVQTDPGNDKYSPWKKWSGKCWHSTYLFRASPRKPATKMVVSHCYRDKMGKLNWFDDGLVNHDPVLWKRFPAGDFEGEIEVN